MKNETKVAIAFAVLMLALGVNDALRGVFSNIFATHFSLSATELAQIVTVSYSGNLIFLLFGGRLIDHLERKKAILLFIALWMCALALFVGTDSYICILIGVFFAMGTSTLLSTTVNIVTPLLFAASPGVAVGFLFFVQGIGTSGSQSMLGNFAKDFSAWKTVNLVLMCMGMMVIVLLLFSKLPPRPAVQNRMKSHSDTAVIVKNPAFIPMILAFGFYFVAEHGVMNWFVNYAANGLNIATGRAANFTAIFFGGITVGRLLFSPLVDKLGVFCSLTLFGSSAAILYTAGVLLRTNGLWLMGASGLLFSVLYPTLVMTVSKLWPRAVVSGASGMILSIASLADIAFNASFGFLIQKAGYLTGFLMMPAAMVGCAAMLWWLRLRTRQAADSLPKS
ncbi:MAG: MFS transporter [Ruthenibacterium sp.]